MPPWKDAFLRLMNEASVPGASIAILGNGRLEHFVNCGVRSTQLPEAVDENTVFGAASLSKPVFAHLILQLVDRGVLALTAALVDYLPGYLASDPRAAAMTINDVLSHSSGLPNWRSLDHPLRTHFPPGGRFSYSGEGYLYLQKAVEAVTGEGLQVLAQRLLFDPFAMGRSSFVWQSRFEDNRAYPHNAFGVPALSGKPGEANAAWTLQTTAADFARFLLAVLEGARLKAETARLWLSPRIEIRHHKPQLLSESAADVVTHVAWGLGWGLEPDSGLFFHWGDNGPYTAFTIGSVEERSALVVFTNGASGHSIIPELVAQFVPGERPSVTRDTMHRCVACCAPLSPAESRRYGPRSRTPGSIRTTFAGSRRA